MTTQLLFCIKTTACEQKYSPLSLYVEAIWRLQLVAAAFCVRVSISGVIIDSCLFLIELSEKYGSKITV